MGTITGNLTKEQAIAKAAANSPIERRDDEIGWMSEGKWQGINLKTVYMDGVYPLWTMYIVQEAATYFGFTLAQVGEAHRGLRICTNQVDTDLPMEQRLGSLLRELCKD